MCPPPVLLSEVSLQLSRAHIRRQPACLILLNAGRSARTWVLDPESSNVLGRDSRYCNLVLDDAKVSRRHADIRCERGRFVLYDLQSSSGTWVNDKRIQRQRLQPFHRIRLGNTTLLFVPGRRLPVSQDGHGPASSPSADHATCVAGTPLPSPAMSTAQRWCVVGSSTRDVYICVDDFRSTAHEATFGNGCVSCAIPLKDGPATWGRKCTAREDLVGHAHMGEIKVGGGVWHSSLQLVERIAAHSLPIEIVPIDDRQCWDQIAAGYQQQGLHGIFVGRHDAPTNLILTNGTPDRIVVKLPVVEPCSTEAQLRDAVQSACGPAQVLLINSPKDRCLARLASDVAQAAGAVQYSVLSPSLPLVDRIGLLLARDTASVCNLTEFHQIGTYLGYVCPSDEASADLLAVARVMVQVAHTHAAGDLVVTLGERGCLVADRTAGIVAHIALHPDYATIVRRSLRSCAEGRNGMSDRFFGSFALAHALAAASGCLPRALYAALTASMDMLPHLVPGTQPAASWFVLRLLPVCFPACSSLP